jgi:hypothetical protein
VPVHPRAHVQGTGQAAALFMQTTRVKLHDCGSVLQVDARAKQQVRAVALFMQTTRVKLHECWQGRASTLVVSWVLCCWGASSVCCRGFTQRVCVNSRGCSVCVTLARVAHPAAAPTPTTLLVIWRAVSMLLGRPLACLLCWFWVVCVRNEKEGCSFR